MSSEQWGSRTAYLVLMCFLTILCTGEARHKATLIFTARKICGHRNVYPVLNKTGHFSRYCCKCKYPLIRIADCAFGVPGSTNCACPSANKTEYLNSTKGTTVKTTAEREDSPSTPTVKQETSGSKKTAVLSDSENAYDYSTPLPDNDASGDRNHSEEINAERDELMHCAPSQTNFNIGAVYFASFVGALAAIIVCRAVEHFIFPCIATWWKNSSREEESDSQKLINHPADEKDDHPDVRIPIDDSESNRNKGKKRQKFRRRIKSN